MYKGKRQHTYVCQRTNVFNETNIYTQKTIDESVHENKRFQ